MSNPAETHYLNDAIAKAEDMFWRIIANSFPNIDTGDMDPSAAGRLHNAMEKAAREWLNANKANHYGAPEPEAKPKVYEAVQIVVVDQLPARRTCYYIAIDDPNTSREHVIGYEHTPVEFNYDANGAPVDRIPIDEAHRAQEEGAKIWALVAEDSPHDGFSAGWHPVKTYHHAEY